MLDWVLKLETDREILQQFAEGNVEQAALRLVKTYKNFVYLIAYRYLKSHDDAEDITQEVFIKALEKLKSFRLESTIKTWLYRITVNYSKNFLRKKALYSFFSIDKANEDDERFDIPDSTESAGLEYKELEEKFLQTVANLPEKQREVFSLRYFDKLSFNEISKLLGTSVGGLKANYFHAIRKIANEMKKYLEI
jgi:RNA polymerase sigma-70 factor (ECF subfamily)